MLQVKIRVLDRERKELEQRLEEERHTPEVCFVEQAMRELDTRLSNTVDSGSTDIDAKLSDVFGALNLPRIVDSNEENGVERAFALCIPEAAEDFGIQQVGILCPSYISLCFSLPLLIRYDIFLQHSSAVKTGVGRRRNESFGNDSVGTVASDDDLTSPLPKHAGSDEYFYFYQGK